MSCELLLKISEYGEKKAFFVLFRIVPIGGYFLLSAIVIFPWKINFDNLEDRLNKQIGADCWEIWNCYSKQIKQPNDKQLYKWHQPK